MPGHMITVRAQLIYSYKPVRVSPYMATGKAGLGCVKFTLSLVDRLSGGHLRASPEGLNFQALFSTSTDALLLTDKQGCIIEANHAVQKLLGYTVQEITGRYIDSLIPNYYQTNRYALGQLNKPPKQRLVDKGQALTVLCRDGSCRQIEIDLSILKPHNYPYVLIVLKDSSHLLRQKQRLSESVESHKAMIEQAIVGILQLDLHGEIAQANQCFCDITGYSKNELRGVKLLDLAHPEERSVLTGRFQHLVNEDRSFSSESRYLHKDGRVLWLNVSLSRISGALRTPTGCFAVVMDVTERTATAQALWASEERLRLAESAANLGVFDLDFLNDSIQCNQQVLNVWGFDSDEALNHEKFLEGIHPDDREARTSAFFDAIDPAGTGEYQHEYRVINRDDKHETWVSVTARTFFKEGAAKRTVGIVQDISKRKQIEDQRQQNGMAMRTLLKQQVAAMTASAIAHELNQPLAAISAYSEVARRSLEGDNANIEQLKRALKGSIEQAQRAGQTLHDLLVVLQQNTISVETIDITALIKETVATAQNDGFGGFPVALELQARVPRVVGSRTQIQMVLLNLIRNGVDAMREAKISPLSITVKLQEYSESNMALVSVIDNGPGLDAEAAEQIFDPFFTTKSKGIGMGLAISRALIQANGGHLWNDKNVQSGAVFHFTLPFAS